MGILTSRTDGMPACGQSRARQDAWRSVGAGASRRPVTLLRTAIRPTTTTSACAATVSHGCPFDHHDFGLCRDSWSRPSIQPPRLRPVLVLPAAAVRSSTTTSAFSATGHHGRPPNHHHFSRCRHGPSRPSAQPPRLRPMLPLLIPLVRRTTTASAYAATADHGCLLGRHGFGLCRYC